MLLDAKRPVLDTFSAVKDSFRCPNFKQKSSSERPKDPLKSFCKSRTRIFSSNCTNLRFAPSRAEAEAILAWAVKLTDAFTGGPISYGNHDHMYLDWVHCTLIHIVVGLFVHRILLPDAICIKGRPRLKRTPYIEKDALRWKGHLCVGVNNLMLGIKMPVSICCRLTGSQSVGFLWAWRRLESC